MALTKAKLIADGVIDVDNLAAGHSITTSNIGEGSNLYYTDGRVASYLTTNSYATEGFVTTGYLPLSGGNITGNFTVDTDTLFVDAANNRVGIGTTSFVSGEVLRVSGAISLPHNSPILLQDSAGNNRNAFNLTTSDVLQIGAAAAGITAITIGTSGAERMRIDSSGNVGIGTSSPVATLDVLGTFAISNSAISSWIFDRNGIDGSLTISEGASEKLRLLPTGGLTFNGDTAAANALDDYEEGTWTMALAFGALGSSGATYSENTGTYTKIGRQVTVMGYFLLTNKGSGTGFASIGGLPFTSAAGNSFYGGVSIGYQNNITFANQMVATVEPNNTRIDLREVTEAGAHSALTDADFANNSEIIFTATYFV